MSDRAQAFRELASDPDRFLAALRASGIEVHVGYRDGKEIDRITSLHLIWPWVLPDEEAQA